MRKQKREREREREPGSFHRNRHVSIVSYTLQKSNNNIKGNLSKQGRSQCSMRDDASSIFVHVVLYWHVFLSIVPNWQQQQAFGNVRKRRPRRIWMRRYRRKKQLKGGKKSTREYRCQRPVWMVFSYSDYCPTYDPSRSTTKISLKASFTSSTRKKCNLVNASTTLVFILPTIYHVDNPPNKAPKQISKGKHICVCFLGSRVKKIPHPIHSRRRC